MARKSRANQVIEPEILQEKVDLAAMYTRLSVEDGDGDENNSIGNQKKIGMNYMAEHPEIRLVETYVDNGFSGMSYERPDFQRMMTDLRRGKINCVIVKDISRLGRHFLQTSEFVECTFPEMGVRLICINDNYDSADPHADPTSLTMPLKMIMNDYYVKDISKKIRTGIDTKINSGEYIPASGSIPYGYIRNPKEATFDIDEEAAPVVRRIFEMRAEGANYTAIASALNQDGIPSPGKLRVLRGEMVSQKNENAIWIRGTVRKILADQVYIGNRVHGKIKRQKIGSVKARTSPEEWVIVENAHEPIVSKELFDRVQAVTEGAKEKRSTYQKRADVGQDYRDLLRNKIFCADCGSYMSSGKGCARPNSPLPSRIFYDCNQYRYSNHTCCSSHYIRQESIMFSLINLLDQQIRVAVDVKKMAQEIKKMPSTKAYNQAATHRCQSASVKRRQVEAKIERLTMDLIERIIDRPEYELLKMRYQEELDYWVDEEARAQEDKNDLDAALAACTQWIDTIEKYGKLPEINREIVDLLVDRIEIGADKHIKIMLTYSDPYQPLNSFLERVQEVADAV